MRAIQPTYESALLQVRAYRALRARVAETLEPYGITVSQWSVLGILHAAPAGIRRADMAAALEVSAPFITGLVDGLEVLGAVEQAERGDKRERRVRLSRTGMELVDEVEAALDAMGRGLFAGIPEADMRAYFRVLRAIASAD